MLLAALLSASLHAQAPDTVRPDPKPSARLKAALAETARELRKSETGRRLLALTEDLPVVERPRRPGDALAFEAGRLVVDAERAPALSALEWELLSVRERWRAAAGLPGESRDGAMAAAQAVLEHALEKTEVDPDFASALRAATSKVRRALEERRALRDWARKNGSGGEELFPGPAPAGALEGLAFDVYLFSEDPYLFYSRAAPQGPPTLDEARDFLDRHGEALARAEWRGGFAVIDGRMYPEGPARLAAALGRDGLRRLGERLGDFRGRPREALLKRVNAWLRSAP